MSWVNFRTDIIHILFITFGNHYLPEGDVYILPSLFSHVYTPFFLLLSQTKMT